MQLCVCVGVCQFVNLFQSCEDATCPLSKEKLLYEELEQVRALLRVDLCNHSHTDMHKPHMEDPTIFEAWQKLGHACETTTELSQCS